MVPLDKTPYDLGATRHGVLGSGICKRGIYLHNFERSRINNELFEIYLSEHNSKPKHYRQSYF